MGIMYAVQKLKNSSVTSKSFLKEFANDDVVFIGISNTNTSSQTKAAPTLKVEEGMVPLTKEEKKAAKIAKLEKQLKELKKPKKATKPKPGKVSAPTAEELEYASAGFSDAVRREMEPLVEEAVRAAASAASIRKARTQGITVASSSSNVLVSSNISDQAKDIVWKVLGLQQQQSGANSLPGPSTSVQEKLDNAMQVMVVGTTGTLFHFMH